MPMESLSAEAKYVLQFINQTYKSVFLTGKAGTGKTTLLKEILSSTHKKTVVVAPTGIAALNAGGVTIHSMFQLPFGGFIPSNSPTSPLFNAVKFETKDTLKRHFKMGSVKRQVIQNMELLIIDEVSMLRCDMLDAIDFMLQSIRKKRQPFGGVQVLFIGDLLQLPPVIKDEEWKVLRNYYKGRFFFHAYVIQQYPPLYIELSKIYRQSDSVFIDLLNNLRNNTITHENMVFLNQFVQPNFNLKEHKGYITLTTHNVKADQINSQSLQDLPGNSKKYSAKIVGDFPEKIYPLEADLELKVGAQIIFIKNDLSIEKNFFNGKMGVIKSLADEEIRVHFPDENKSIELERYEWQNIRYSINENTKEIEEEVLGTFVHYPIKLAWAITVHKSQGLTFDKAALDVSQVFLPGQAYVALSRLRSLNGLILLSPMQMKGIATDDDVVQYATHKASTEDLEKELAIATQNFIHHYLKTSFAWEEVIQQWRIHKFSYLDNNKSLKYNYIDWAKTQFELAESLLIPAQKFRQQLDTLFQTSTVDYAFVNERIGAAYDYFFEKWDTLEYQLLYKIQEISRVKQAKQFCEELLVLEDLQINAILQLMRAKELISSVVEGKTISKATWHSSAMYNYRQAKMDRVIQDFKANNLSLLEDDETLSFYPLKKKKPEKKEKKATTQITYELWLEKQSITEIATSRKLTVSTIYSHLTKLIQEEKIPIEAIMPQDKIDILHTAFKNYKEDSLTAMKDQLNDEFSWEELRMFKASLSI